MKISELLETASGGGTSSGSIATVVNPQVANPFKGNKKKAKQPKVVKQSPSDNALDMNTSLFGGPVLKR